MTPQFKNMNDLVEYLGVLEQRVNVLEAENNHLRVQIPVKAQVDGNMISRYVSQAFPQTNLINSNFMKRAFAVWGHFFVANLIISTIAVALYICLMLVLGASLFGSIINNVPK